jgi:hypothetical protein
MRLAQAEGFHPAHAVAGRRQNPRDLAADRVDVAFGHCWQGCSAALTRALIAESQVIQRAAEFRIEPRQRRGCRRQRAQKLKRIAALADVIFKTARAMKHFIRLIWRKVWRRTLPPSGEAAAQSASHC